MIGPPIRLDDWKVAKACRCTVGRRLCRACLDELGRDYGRLQGLRWEQTASAVLDETGARVAPSWSALARLRWEQISHAYGLELVGGEQALVARRAAARAGRPRRRRRLARS